MAYRVDGEVLELSLDESVIQVRFDHAVTVVTDSLLLRLATAFVLEPEGGSPIEVVPEHLNDPTVVIKLVSLFRQPVQTVSYDLDGNLTMRVDGARLVASPHPDYEAWTVSGDSGVHVVCNPGGGVTEFG